MPTCTYPYLAVTGPFLVPDIGTPIPPVLLLAGTECDVSFSLHVLSNPGLSSFTNISWSYTIPNTAGWVRIAGQWWNIYGQNSTTHFLDLTLGHFSDAFTLTLSGNQPPPMGGPVPDGEYTTNLTLSYTAVGPGASCTGTLTVPLSATVVRAKRYYPSSFTITSVDGLATTSGSLTDIVNYSPCNLPSPSPVGLVIKPAAPDQPNWDFMGEMDYISDGSANDSGDAGSEVLNIISIGFNLGEVPPGISPTNWTPSSQLYYDNGGSPTLMSFGGSLFGIIPTDSSDHITFSQPSETQTPSPKIDGYFIQQTELWKVSATLDDSHQNQLVSYLCRTATSLGPSPPISSCDVVMMSGPDLISVDSVPFDFSGVTTPSVLNFTWDFSTILTGFNSGPTFIPSAPPLADLTGFTVTSNPLIYQGTFTLPFSRVGHTSGTSFYDIGGLEWTDSGNAPCSIPVFAAVVIEDSCVFVMKRGLTTLDPSSIPVDFSATSSVNYDYTVDFTGTSFASGGIYNVSISLIVGPFAGDIIEPSVTGNPLIYQGTISVNLSDALDSGWPTGVSSQLIGTLTWDSSPSGPTSCSHDLTALVTLPLSPPSPPSPPGPPPPALPPPPSPPGVLPPPLPPRVYTGPAVTVDGCLLDSVPFQLHLAPLELRVQADRKTGLFSGDFEVGVQVQPGPAPRQNVGITNLVTLFASGSQVAFISQQNTDRVVNSIFLTTRPTFWDLLTGFVYDLTFPISVSNQTPRDQTISLSSEISLLDGISQSQFQLSRPQVMVRSGSVEIVILAIKTSAAVTAREEVTVNALASTGMVISPVSVLVNAASDAVTPSFYQVVNSSSYTWTIGSTVNLNFSSTHGGVGAEFWNVSDIQFLVNHGLRFTSGGSMVSNGTVRGPAEVKTLLFWVVKETSVLGRIYASKIIVVTIS